MIGDLAKVFEKHSKEIA
jgi:succinate-semialdehyde dehydrogenase / glutarate-semialdehyde dehydrogenase